MSGSEWNPSDAIHSDPPWSLGVDDADGDRWRFDPFSPLVPDAAPSGSAFFDPLDFGMDFTFGRQDDHLIIQDETDEPGHTHYGVNGSENTGTLHHPAQFGSRLVQGTGDPRRPPRRPQASTWTTHKAKIRQLYLEEDKTLKETQEVMENELGFVASVQMYKEKFRDWGFSKNISNDVAGKLTRIADERKPKDTEFRLGPRTWTANEVKKKHSRGKDPCASMLTSPVLPVGLSWRTPTPTMSPAMQAALILQSPNMVAVSPQISMNQDSFSSSNRLPYERSPFARRNDTWYPNPGYVGVPWSSPRSITPQNTLNTFRVPAHPILPRPPSMPPWSREKLPPLASSGHDISLLRPFSSSGTWNGKTLTELQIMRREALLAVSEGSTQEGISKLQNVVEGFQHLLAPTHNFTLQSGYELAQILGVHDDNMNEAHMILEWLGLSLVKKHGLRHARTLDHYFRVGEILRTWSRDEDAKLLMYKIAQLWGECDPDDPDCVQSLKIPGAGPSPMLPIDADAGAFGTLLKEPNSADDVDIQLQLIRVLLASQDNLTFDLQSVLRGLISYSGEHDLVISSLNARCCLATSLRGENQASVAIEVLDAAHDTLKEHLQHIDELPRPLLEACKELAFLYHDFKKPDESEDLLELTLRTLEWRTRCLCSADGHQNAAVVDFAISIGVEWQKRLSWEFAVPWFQRALANSIIMLGPRHHKTEMLEISLENRILGLPSDGILDL